MEGGSYKDAVATESVTDGLLSAPDIKLRVPIRFQKRYEDMARDNANSDPEGD